MPTPPTMTGYLALCCMAKDENRYLPEWIVHHLLLGVDRFIVYDNGSAVPLAETLAPYVDLGIVVVEVIPGPERQLAAYARALRAHGPGFKWMGFLDVDEFVLPLAGQDLPAFLSGYEEHAALGLHWAVFGSSGHLARPPGLQTESYLHRFPLDQGVNCTVKAVVQPALALAPASPHHFRLAPGHCAVNEHRFPLGGPYGVHTSDRIRVNHYFFRSQREFAEKIERGRGDMSREKFTHSMESFYVQAREATVEDRSMLPLARRTARVLAGEEPLPRPRERLGLPEHQARVAEALAAGDLPRALDLCGLFGLDHPDSPAPWLVRGLVLRRLGRTDEAVAALDRSIRREETLEAHYQLMLAMAEKGEGGWASRVARYIRWRLDKGTWAIQGEGAEKALADLARFL